MTSRRPLEKPTAGANSLAARWRSFCQEQPQRFSAFEGSSAARLRSERFESGLFDLLLSPDGSLELKAVAFRRIIDLRSCTARDLGNFAAVDPKVIVRALSLLEAPAPTPAEVATPTRRSRSRTKAA